MMLLTLSFFYFQHPYALFMKLSLAMGAQPVEADNISIGLSLAITDLLEQVRFRNSYWFTLFIGSHYRTRLLHSLELYVSSE